MSKQKIYKFSENTLSLVGIKTIELGLTIFLIPYLILKVGMVNYGYYAFAMAFIFIFTNVLNYGFNLTTVRELAKNKHNATKINELFSEVLSVKLVLFGFLYLLILVLILVFPKFGAQKELYFYASLVLVGELFSLRWFFLGLEQLKFKALIHLINTAVYIVLVLLFIQEASDYKYIPLYYAIGMLSVAVISFLWVMKTYKIKLKLSSLKQIGSYLTLNFSSFINLVVPSTFGIMAVFLVGVFGLPVYVSFMQIGVKIASAFSTVNTVLTKVFYPMVNRNSTILLSSRMLLLSLGVLLSLGMFFMSDFIIYNWLSKEGVMSLEKMSSIVKLLSPIPLLMAIISSYGINGLLLFYKDKLYGKITLVSFLTMGILSVLLIPTYHFYGGGLALLIGRLVHAGLSYSAFKKFNQHG